MEHIYLEAQWCTNISNFKDISNIDIQIIEVRDSRTGYLGPARDGSGLLPDWEGSWDVAAAAVTWKFRLTFWPGNYVWSCQIGF